jgi:hypothetical protein
MRPGTTAFAIMLTICLIIGAGFPATAHSAGQDAGQAYESGSSIPGYGEKGPTSPPSTPAYRKPDRTGDPTGLSGPPTPYERGEALGGSTQAGEFSGRLVKMGGGYGLVAKDGKAYALQDGPKDMSRMVGQEVTVQGSLTGSTDPGKRSVIKVRGMSPAK